MGMPAEQLETATEQVIEFDGPDLSEDGFEDDVQLQEDRERLDRMMSQ